MNATSRADVVNSLCKLREFYKWGRLGVSVTSTSHASCDAAVYCEPCATNPSPDCITNFPEDRITVSDVDECGTQASMSPVTTYTPKSRRRVVIDDSEDECVERRQNMRTVHSESVPFVDTEEIVVQRAPMSARSKSKFVVLSDSEDESLTIPTRYQTTTPNRRIFCEEDEAIEDNSPEKSFDGEAEVVDGESIGFSGDEARSVDGSYCEDSDEHDWIVNSSEEEETSFVESDLSEDDEYNHHVIRPKSKENKPQIAVNKAPPSNKKNASATPRKAHFVDLSQSPDTPPRLANTNTKGKINASTPKSTKKNALAMSTPVRNISQTELNSQRVAALSTGKKKFKSVCVQLAQDLYHLYNEIIFDSQLPKDLPVLWSKRMLTTAGFCKCRKTTLLGSVVRSVSIELSTKVLDDEERLRSTLIHEMCHAANFLIDQLDNEGHGRAFKKWGRKATKHFPEITVDTCHSYDIHAPHKFQCVNGVCGVVYSRHSKKGINVLKQFCGVCKGMLEYQGIGDKEGNIAKPRQATAFSIYVKEHFPRVKAELSSMSGGTKLSTTAIMKELGVQYRAEKEAFTGTAVSNVGVTVTSLSERVELDLTGEVSDGQEEEHEQQEVEIDELYNQFTALVF